MPLFFQGLATLFCIPTALLHAAQISRLMNGLKAAARWAPAAQRLHFEQNAASRAFGAQPAILEREVDLAMRAGDRYLAAYEMVLGHDISEDITRLRQPAVLIFGDKDSLWIARSHAQDLFPAAPTEILTGAGTYACETHVTEIASIIQQYVQPLGGNTFAKAF